MKRILKRYLAILLVFVLALQVINVNVLAENDTVISAQSEAETTEKKEAEVKAEEKTTEIKQSEEKKQESSESKKEEKAEAKKEETTQNKPENATTEVAQEATTEASEAASEATIEEEKEEAAFSSKVKQTAMVSEDGQLSVRYSVTVTNIAKNAKAEDFTVKIAFGKNVSYYADDRQTSGLNYVKDLANMPSRLDFDELTGNYTSAAIWKDQSLDAGDSKTYEVYAKAGEEALSISDLQPAFYVAGKRVEAADIQWTNSALIEEKLADTTKTYIYEDDEKTVTAVVSDKNALPADAEFVVKNVSAKRTEEVEELLREQLVNKAAKKAKGQDVQDIAGLVVYDMHFAVDGKEIEPENAEVKVSIRFKKAKDLSADDTKVSVEDAVIMHIEDNGKITDVTDDVALTKKGKVSGGEFTTDSFSEYAAITLGTPEYTSDTKFPAKGYALEYILNQFNIVSFGDTELNIHCMGGILSKGSLSGNGSGFSDSEQVTVPSYIGGLISNFSGIYHSRNHHPEVPLYVGTDNTVTNDGKDLNGIGGFNAHGAGVVYETDDYLDWDKLYSAVKGTVNGLQNYSTESYEISGDNWQTIQIPAGATVSLTTNGKYARIQLTGDTSKTTVINIKDSGNVYLPQVTGMGSGEDGDSMPIAFTFPNASKVTIPTALTPAIGHVVAPDAEISIEGGNYNGCMVGKSVTSSGEGHMWPYIGGSLIPVSQGFKAVKTVDDKTPADDEIFAFNLDELTDGSWQTIQTKNNNGEEIVFDEISYGEGSEGTHWYRITEEQTPVDGYTLSEAQYFVKVDVTSKTDLANNTVYEKEITYYKLKDPSVTEVLENGNIKTDALTEVDNPESDFSFANKTKEEKGSLTLKKVINGDVADNDLTDEQKARITFTVTGPNDYRKVITYDQFTNGTYTIGDLATGEYTVVESGADVLNGYSNSVIYSVTGGKTTVNNGQTSEITITNTYSRDKGSLKLKKVINGDVTDNDLTDEQKEKITFTVTGPDGYRKVATYDQFTNGTYTIGNLATGEYTVVESGADVLDGYSHSVIYSVTGGKTTVNKGQTSEITITNTYSRDKGSLKLKKVINGDVTDNDLTDEQKAKIKFTVTGPNDYRKVITYDQFTNGTYTIGNLATGEYTVVESGADVLGGYSHSVIYSVTGGKTTVNKGQTSEITITNTYSRDKGSLKLTKVFDGDIGDGDLTDEQKKAITFTVTGPNNYKEEVTYDQFTDGSYTINNLPTGIYQVVETGADMAGGYNHKVTYSVDGKATVVKDQTGEITITNTYTRKRGSIDVTKYVYQIYDNELVEIIPKEAQFRIGLFTDKNGTQLYEGDDGEYESIRTVTLENQSASTVTFDNLPVGETYYLYEVREDGTAVKDGEKVDDYSYCQVSEGSSSKVEMALNADEVPEKVNLDNVYFDLPEGWKYNASISVSKELIKNGEVVTEDGDEIFRIGIFKENDLKNPFRTVEIKAGEALKVPVELGGENGDESIKYYIYELNDDGERADRDPGFVYDITVDKSNNEVTVTKENTDHFVKITNTEKTAFMALSARKMLDEKAPGKEKFAFGLFEQGSETPLQIKNNDTDGNISFDEITYTYADIGTKIYEVKEIVPEQKKAYVYDKTVYTVKVTISNDNGTLKTDVELMKGDQKVTEMQFNNRSTKLSVQKVDYETGKTVSNATLAVFDKDNQEIERWISGEEAHEISGKLIVGETYTLRELKAPEGYYLAADMSFTVPEDGTISLTMKDLKLKKKSGQIQVTKQISYLDADFNIVDLIANDAVFKVGLYTDSEGKHPYGNDYIREIHLVNQSVSNPVVYNNLPTGTYYVFELDKDGNPITTIDIQTDGGKRYSCNVDGDDPANTSLALDLNADVVEGKINLQNVYYDIPDGYRYKASINVTKEVLKNSTKVTVNDTFYAGVFTRNEAEEYELYTVAELVQNGTVKFDVPLGGDNGDEPVTYYVFETDSEGNVIEQSEFAYDISGEGEVTVSKDNIVADKKITNTTNDTKESSFLLDIMKITEDGKSLKGATFELTSEDGEIVATWTSEKQSKKFALKPGAYILEELKAPKGYILGSDVEITIDEKGKITVSGENVTLDESTLKYINEKETTKKTEKKKSTTSKTGDRTPIGFWLILCLGAVTMSVFFGIRRLYFRGNHNR